MLSHHTAPPATIGVRVQSVELTGAIYREAVGGDAALVRAAFSVPAASGMAPLSRRYVLSAGHGVSLVKVTR